MLATPHTLLVSSMKTKPSMKISVAGTYSIPYNTLVTLVWISVVAMVTIQIFQHANELLQQQQGHYHIPAIVVPIVLVLLVVE